MERYFEMYAVTARALKSVSTRLRVGGPATSEDMINVSSTVPAFGTSWIGNFTKYCEANDVPYDFVSNHNCAPYRAASHK
jgi:xylan 1,4-beta-xylosidase